MFERFSRRARRVVVLAQQESRALGHDYIGTEHLLIAVLHEEVGVARAVLATVPLTAEDARAAVLASAGRGDGASTGYLPITPRAKRAHELAPREGLAAGQREAGPEDLLLALLTEGEGVAARILFDAGADAEAIRAAVIEFSAVRPDVPGAERQALPAEVPEVEVDLGWLGRPIALAAVGAAVLARSVFDPRRTGGLTPIECSCSCISLSRTGQTRAFHRRGTSSR
jgi:ATP-dependent Clp protease ATP-binding subunit ClpC